jgi:hypothetical protein
VSEEIKLARHEWATVLIFCVMFLGLVSVTYEPFIPPPETESVDKNVTRKVEKKTRKPRKTKTTKKSFAKIEEL